MRQCPGHAGKNVPIGDLASVSACRCRKAVRATPIIPVGAETMCSA